MIRPKDNCSDTPTAILVWLLCLIILTPWGWMPQARAAVQHPSEGNTTDTIIDARLMVPVRPAEDIDLFPADTTVTAQGDSILNVVVDPTSPYGPNGKRIFNPSPTRAVWLSALLPGLGQIYNRRYWKLPIIVGGFMGLGYATSWNNNQFQDYSQGYRDLLDNDPNTRSYMNFFPPTTKEEDLDKSWLQQTLRSRKDYYRRNRDLCIICMAGLYLLCMVDAYVDASLAHFDLSPNLSMDVQPAIYIDPSSGSKPAIGLNWAFNF